MGKDKIILKDMAFYGYHGVLIEEKQLGQKYLVDVEMNLNLQPAGSNDDLRLTVNYAEVYEIVQEIVTQEKYDLIETVGEKIAQRVLEKFSIVNSIKVLVKKPEVPIPGILAYTAIEIVRER